MVRRCVVIVVVPSSWLCTVWHRLPAWVFSPATCVSVAVQRSWSVIWRQALCGYCWRRGLLMLCCFHCVIALSIQQLCCSQNTFSYRSFCYGYVTINLFYSPLLHQEIYKRIFISFACEIHAKQTIRKGCEKKCQQESHLKRNTWWTRRKID